MWQWQRAILCAMDVRVTRRGVEVPKDSAVGALVRKELLVAPISLNDPFPKHFRVFLETPTRYIVPLHWARTALQPFRPQWVDTRPEPRRLPHMRFAGTLRAELQQPQAVRAVQDSWAQCGGAMLCLPVGYGKVSAARDATNPTTPDTR